MVVQNGSPAFFKMQASGANRDRTRNPMDLRSAALVLAGRRHGFDSPPMLYTNATMGKGSERSRLLNSLPPPTPRRGASDSR